MKFTVIDTKTGEYPDLWEIALKEEWAKSLCYCDMEGFAVEEDGTLFLMDECGRYEYAPEDRFIIFPLVETNADRIRAMTDEELAHVLRNPCDIADHGPTGWCKERNCGYQCALEWLKQEVADKDVAE